MAKQQQTLMQLCPDVAPPRGLATFVHRTGAQPLARNHAAQHTATQLVDDAIAKVTFCHFVLVETRSCISALLRAFVLGQPDKCCDMTDSEPQLDNHSV